MASSVDDSMIELLWSTMQRELVATRTWDSPEQLGLTSFGWIEAWYYPGRVPDVVGCRSARRGQGGDLRRADRLPPRLQDTPVSQDQAPRAGGPAGAEW